MAGETAGTIFALVLALGIGATVAGRWFAPPSLRAELEAAALPLAALVAVGATAGSLYFSEVENFAPCELCWYQRIAMYPLAIILTIAAVRRDHGIRLYAVTLAALGAAVSIYHVQLQAFPDQGSSCSIGPSCTFRWLDVFGFVSIPVLALGCFILIVLLLTMPRAPVEGPDDTVPVDQMEIS